MSPCPIQLLWIHLSFLRASRTPPLPPSAITSPWKWKGQLSAIRFPVSRCKLCHKCLVPAALRQRVPTRGLTMIVTVNLLVCGGVKGSTVPKPMLGLYYFHGARGWTSQAMELKSWKLGGSEHRLCVCFGVRTWKPCSLAVAVQFSFCRWLVKSLKPELRCDRPTDKRYYC